MNKADISVVIVNYNVRDYLYQCLRSAEAAKGNLKVEIIVVDNDSKDGSVEYLQPLFPKVNFIKNAENVGFGKANNIGFEKANGKYILILNPDTIIEEKTLEVMYDYMENNPQTGISGCKVLNPDGSFQLACRRGFPTPWASFTKLFGLQSLFPNSKLFARYNQTYRSIDETYYIDSVIGAFMFARKEVIDKLNGFDPDFFMYGEDIDLCFRTKELGYEIAYVHETSIIHFKGESTKRSAINDVHHFYEAMKIFAQKHYGSSPFFLSFLKLGIAIRSVLAYLSGYSRQIFVIAGDLAIVNAMLMLATKIRFESILGFPDYAYPVVFIAVSAVLIISMISVGEYFESDNKVIKSIYAYMISFFILSSLTYFFKDFAFSRGVVLMTIGFSAAGSSLLRIGMSIVDNTLGKKSDKNIIIAGVNRSALKITEKLKSAENMNIKILGYVKSENSTNLFDSATPILGNFDMLYDIIDKNDVDEVIITDENTDKQKILNIISSLNEKPVRFHFATEYEELLASQTIEYITGEHFNVKKYNLASFRFRFIKRSFDFGLSLLMLTLFLPFSLIITVKHSDFLKNMWKVLSGKRSFVGLKDSSLKVREGLISLHDLIGSETLNKKTKEKISDHYLQNYSLALDLEIMFKYLIRR